jgi:hypothetical protein
LDGFLVLRHGDFALHLAALWADQVRASKIGMTICGA